jgi:hypothetical protein
MRRRPALSKILSPRVRIALDVDHFSLTQSDQYWPIVPSSVVLGTSGNSAAETSTIC